MEMENKPIQECPKNINGKLIIPNTAYKPISNENTDGFTNTAYKTIWRKKKIVNEIINPSYEYFLFTKVTKLLLILVDLILKQLSNLNSPICKNINKHSHVYYLVLKWYIYQCGIDNCRFRNTPDELVTELPDLFRNRSNKITTIPINIHLFDYSQLEFDIKHTLCDKFVMLDTFHMAVCTEINKIRTQKIKYHSFFQTQYEKTNYTIIYYPKLERIVYTEVQFVRNIQKILHVSNVLYNKLYNSILPCYSEKLNEQQKINLIFCMLLRYEIFKENKSGINLGIDVIYNHLMRNHLLQKDESKAVASVESEHENFSKLTVELFASPVNRHLPIFCSLYPDLEKYFGSIGSFFDLIPSHSIWKEHHYFVCNPPYDELIMYKMAKQLISVLELNSNEKICIIVSIPDWRQTESNPKYNNVKYNSYNLLKESPFFHFETIYNNSFRYMDYFKDETRTIGQTGTIIMVIKTRGFNIKIYPEDFNF
jgi:hypothetical protein